jgi:preprotein translocase subunit SecE
VNRQTKRLMQRQGADKPRAPEQRRAQARQQRQEVVGRERVTPLQYLDEARSELRKVNWPSRQEVVNSTIVVLICVVVVTALIFGFDYLSSKFVLWMFG